MIYSIKIACRQVSGSVTHGAIAFSDHTWCGLDRNVRDEARQHVEYMFEQRGEIVNCVGCLAEEP